MSETASVLAAQAVSVELGGRKVLDRIDFGIRAGELVGVLGPNGAGKTTLLRALAGLQSLAGGSVQLLGREIAGCPAAERARRLSYLPQGGRCHWAMSVEQVIALGRLPHRAPWARLPKADDAAVQRAMQATDVAHLALRPVTELSGGERARVLLARALAVEARILLADEPIGGLDPAHQLGLMDLLRSKTQGGTAVAVTLHDLTLAARYCERVVLLDEGRAVAAGPPADVLGDEQLARVYGIEVQRLRSEGGLLLIPLRSATRPDC